MGCARALKDSRIQFRVQSATVERSLTKMRLPEIDGAGQVALFATVYVLIASNAPGVARATISSASAFNTKSRLPARTMAAFSAWRGLDVHSVFPVLASPQKNCPLFIAE